MASSNHSVDVFENAFRACMAALTNPDYFSVHDSEEVKTGVEQAIQKFLDAAKQVDGFFLQKRLALSAQKPEQIVMEDITGLKNALARKKQLLQKFNEKILYWQSLLNDTSNTPGQQPQAPPGSMPQGMPTQGQQCMPMGNSAQGLPGPLAYLEQTTSNIGMPSPRQ